MGIRGQQHGADHDNQRYHEWYKFFVLRHCYLQKDMFRERGRRPFASVGFTGTDRARNYPSNNLACWPHFSNTGQMRMNLRLTLRTDDNQIIYVPTGSFYSEGLKALGLLQPTPLMVASLIRLRQLLPWCGN